MTVTADRLADLARANRPGQFTVLEQAIDLFSASPAVTALMVRGSLAAGTSDRLSDVDLIAGIRDRDFAELAGAHNRLISSRFCQVLPGWPDTIVPDFGGLGWVHMLQHDGRLCQLDLYLIPASRVPEIPPTIRRQVICTAPAAVADPADAEEAALYVAGALAAGPDPASLVTEVMILASMICKRLSRGQQFMAYKEAHQLVTAVRTLIRTALFPGTSYLGWYHLEEMTGRTPIGRSCLAVLAELTALPAVPSSITLPRMVDLALHAAELAAPETADELRPGIDTIRYLTGLLPGY